MTRRVSMMRTSQRMHRETLSSWKVTESKVSSNQKIQWKKFLKKTTKIQKKKSYEFRRICKRKLILSKMATRTLEFCLMENRTIMKAFRTKRKMDQKFKLKKISNKKNSQIWSRFTSNKKTLTCSMRMRTFLSMKTMLHPRMSFRTNLSKKNSSWLSSLFLRQTICFAKKDGVTGPDKESLCLKSRKTYFNKKRKKEGSKQNKQNSREKMPCSRRSSSTKALQKILEI